MSELIKQETNEPSQKFTFERQKAPKPKSRWFSFAPNKKKMYFKEKAIIRIRDGRYDVSNVTSTGPMVFGFYPLRWAYSAFNSMKDYFFARGHHTFLKATLLDGTIKAAVNHVDKVRMRKIGEIDMSANKAPKETK